MGRHPVGASGICLFIPDLVTRGLALVCLAVFVVRNLMQARQAKLLTVAGGTPGYDPKERL